MLNKGLVSVIVPIYNVETFLERCLNSIVKQSYTNLEIILVDDESPDNCGDICDRWAERDNRIKVIHKKNGGLGFARNSGLDIATGEFVAFVDSDDYITYDFIEKYVNHMILEDADLVIGGLTRKFIDGSEIKKQVTDSTVIVEKII